MSTMEEVKEDVTTVAVPSSVGQHHPILEKIVDILVTKTQNQDRKFFRVLTAYYLAKMATSQRARVKTFDRGEVPTNIFSMAFATSGAGKGYSIYILEKEIFSGFQKIFTEDTFPNVADIYLSERANRNAARNGTDQAEEYKKVLREFQAQGPYRFSFAEGTTPAVKQLRYKLLMANIGAINFEVDEIGSNLTESMEILIAFLELYDQGQIKDKLTKNTADNSRGVQIDGKTPTNALLFGTPSAVLDSSRVEELFYNLLETGYARRSLFAFGERIPSSKEQTAEEIYDSLVNKGNSESVNQLSQHFSYLAHQDKYDWSSTVHRDQGIKLLQYRIDCENLADELPEHMEIRKSELRHRYFKVLKLAGVFAFIDEMVDVTDDHLNYAITLVEESGESFQEIFKRDKPYVKLAKYLSEVGTEQTHADLNEALPFYKTGVGPRNELMNLATAWGYKNNRIIKKNFIDGIEFFQGETLKKTNTDEMIISYSDHFADRYNNDIASFDQLQNLFLQDRQYGFCNHHLENNYRQADNVKVGFNMIILDIDEGTNLWTVDKLLSEYKYQTYTTKSHTDTHHRFRLVIPINYHLNLDAEDYKLFMEGVLSWLPIKVDTTANQRERRWECNPNAIIKINDGQLLDALPFIPKTQKNDSYKQDFQAIESMDNLERWFAQRMVSGNRNNHMLRFAMTLCDNGMTFQEIESRVLKFNSMLSNKLTEDEINSTVLKTVAKRIQER